MPAQSFLQTLFSGKPSNSYILVWTMPDKRSEWFKSPERAAEYVQELQSQVGKYNVYVGVGLSPQDYGAKARCKADDIVGICGLWGDFDIAGTGHKKKNLPPDEGAVRDLLKATGMEPSILVHSGHGLQAWWLFDKPWIFASPEDRKEAADLAAAWTHSLQAIAASKGWDVDATQDLARVLRIPGTVNYKGEPVAVRLLEVHPSLRYTSADFRSHLWKANPLPQAPQTPRPSETTQPVPVKESAGGLVLNPNASPPFDKFEILREIEPKVILSWERKRKDFQDQSASSYDLSLASYAALAGWTDQEITDLLIASRRKHGDDLKLREDYYRRTIAKGREVVKKTKAQETIDELAATDEQAEVEGPKDMATRRATLLEALSDLFDVPISRIVKYLGDPPIYRLETPAGNIILGEVNNLIMQPAFRAKVAAATGRYIPKARPEKWDSIAQTLLDSCEEEGVGEDATTHGTAKAWITDYLQERRPIEDLNDAMSLRLPFVRDGRICIFASDLKKWLNVTQGEKVNSRELGVILRSYGAVPEVVGIQLDSGRSTRSIWRLPGSV